MVYVPILFHLYQIQRAVWSIFPHYIAIQMNTVILFALTLNLTLIKRSHRTQQCSLCERTLGKKKHRNRFAIRWSVLASFNPRLFFFNQLIRFGVMRTLFDTSRTITWKWEKTYDDIEAEVAPAAVAAVYGKTIYNSDNKHERRKCK